MAVFDALPACLLAELLRRVTNRTLPSCTTLNRRSLLVHRRDTAVELIAYYRVSTARQGESGLGLEAQRSKLQQLAADRGAVVVAEFVEVESGRKAERERGAEAAEAAASCPPSQ